MNRYTNFDIDFLLALYGENVIASLTDCKGIITYVSDAYVQISGYSKSELLGSPQNIVRHPDMDPFFFKELWDTISSGKMWKGEIKNLKKNKDFYWVKATITAQKDNEGKIIGYASVRQDITDKKKAIELHTQIRNMIDNIEDGFLIFDKNLEVEGSYSKSCLKILNQNELLKKDISEVLFDNDKEKKETFIFGCKQIFNTECDDTKEIYLSLMPSHHFNSSGEFTIHYKLLENDKLLLLFSDITLQVQLEKKMKYEQKKQKMFISIATNKEESIELIQSFIEFIQNNFEEMDTNKLLMNLHTFKGLFTQLDMSDTIESIHSLETLLKNGQFENLNQKELIVSFYNEIKLITDTFGELFLAPITSVKVELSHVNNLISEVESICKKSNIEQLEEVLESIKHMKNKSFFNMLNIHKSVISNSLQKLEKKLYPLEIIGSKELLVCDKLERFTKSLVHVFMNSIVHGIEEPYKRIEYNKNPRGKIKCVFDYDAQHIFLKISDDGQGIDVDTVIKQAIELNLTTPEKVVKLSNQEILQFIFSNEFSTTTIIDELSGRGVGLASVKYELLKLNGTVTIENFPFKGLSFLFTIPYKDPINKNVKLLSQSFVKTTESFLIKDIKIDILKSETIKQINITDYYSTIQLNGLKNIIFVISLEEKLINKMLEFFLGQNIYPNTKKLQKNLPDEIINIIVGLSINNFSDEYKQMTLGTPIILDKFIIETFIQQNQTVIEKLTTKYGTIELATIIVNTLN